jgi:hypothetical protein
MTGANRTDFGCVYKTDEVCPVKAGSKFVNVVLLHSLFLSRFCLFYGTSLRLFCLSQLIKRRKSMGLNKPVFDIYLSIIYY